MPVGTVTRGTTNTNRLRRVDRWIAVHPVLRRAPDPLVVDLGYGASGVTAFELATRLRRTRADVEVLGLEIDPARVATATAQLARVRAGTTAFSPDLAVSFARGGFEVPAPGGRRPAVIRAFNVLRQYDESEVAGAWARMVERLAPGGLLVEGTCDEVGRIASWVGVDASGPRTFTLSLRLAGLDEPSIVAERLPKALIHRNVPGERVHDLLVALDRAWRVHAPLSVYGPSQRFIRTAQSLRAEGWPVRDGVRRWRLGELTLDWAAVAPR
ncbi:class I SAM-dependent methyltransferase [Agromyces sp. CFH 90414]|uniref:Class I SAM-dependent methyltransferase n=1 Tax=Agromyces agglutinans TaxID=2662258 RepID=A0A6I2FER9_9MICO|nr:class I SAM-dependent methyltransferase [Agromyces agglutinans]MRG61036.1 class I SAM-dependent methyltransferase [Agromyces agglutinans]